MEKLRTCKKCQISKPLTEFKKNCKAKTGYLFTCKACDCLHAHAYRAANPEKVRAAQKVYSITHSEDIKKRSAAYRATDHGKEVQRRGEQKRQIEKATETKARKHAYYLAHREEKLVKDAAYRARNHEKIRERDKKRRERLRTERAKRRRAILEHAAEKPHDHNICLHCGEIQPIEEFVRCASLKRGYRLLCKRCSRSKTKQRREQLSEEEIAIKREKSRAYYREHPDNHREASRRRKARKKNAPINDLSAPQWLEIQIAFNFRCVYCSTHCKQCHFKKHKLTPDHITPYAKNGSNTLWNVVPSCLPCNMRKKIGPPPIPVQPLLLTLALPKK